MRTKIAFVALCFSAVTILSVSCSKDNNNNNTPKSKTELLATGTWTFKSASANGSDISNQNPPFEPCKKDNILTFSAAGTGNINEGATKCNAGDPDNNPFTWSLLSGETTLHISTPLFTGGNSDFTLESLTATELVVSQGYAPPVGSTILIKITFQH